MRARVKYAKNLTPDEYSKCKSLNFRSAGDMFYALPAARRNPLAKVILIDDNDKLVAWSLLIPYVEPDGSYYEGQFYVRRSYRRRGLGKRLVKKAQQTVDNLRICPHDYRSVAFFASIDDDFEPALGFEEEHEKIKRIKEIKYRNLTKQAA
jgi:GNAT superfamily N-acetyltransferase